VSGPDISRSRSRTFAGEMGFFSRLIVERADGEERRRGMGRTLKKKQEKWNAWRLFSYFTASLFIFYVSQAMAAEEVYPNRPINMVVNMAPVGVTDTHVKIVGDRLAEVLGQPILRLHKPGGGGTLAASFVAKAKPDGYTLLTATASAIILSTIVKKVDFTWEDFIPIGIYGAGTLHLFVKADAKWKTLQEFVEEAKARPGQLKVSSYGKLTNADLVIEAFSDRPIAGHVPYKAVPSGDRLLGGHADADFVPPAVDGRCRILAIARLTSKFCRGEDLQRAWL
jgi:tripartite-type tricarboxylate transporter receptor subunit TctC